VGRVGTEALSLRHGRSVIMRRWYVGGPKSWSSTNSSMEDIKVAKAHSMAIASLDSFMMKEATGRIFAA
jgi:hypothetical protein